MPKRKKTSWLPSRKWAARTTVALTGIATTYVVTGSWDVEESMMLITAISGALLSYLVPNAEDRTDPMTSAQLKTVAKTVTKSGNKKSGGSTKKPTAKRKQR